jgi:hypothetical protein
MTTQKFYVFKYIVFFLQRRLQRLNRKIDPQNLCANLKPFEKALGINYLIITVLYDGQVEKLAAMLLG